MKQILIVDDSEMARHSFSFSLKTRKYDVVTAENGKEALDIVNSNDNIGLIVSDLNMPVMNGEELLINIRKDSKNPNIPILILTTEEESGEKMLEAGATGFILKSGSASEEVQRFIEKYIKL